jgi:Kdo2-lipid IVA lauroyltransferase/acyltransferase
MWTQYLALRGVSAMMHAFSVRQNLWTAGLVGSVFYHLNRRRRRRAERHIAESFSGWTPDRVASVAERSMQHMFRLFMVDSLAVPRLVTPNTWPRYIRLGNGLAGKRQHVNMPASSSVHRAPNVGCRNDARDTELGTRNPDVSPCPNVDVSPPLIERLMSREPMILLTGHCGNWELFAHFLALLGYPLIALARPLDNPLINRWLMSIRESRGTRIITKWGATPVIQHALTYGGRIGFIADQNAGEQGLFVPFFGRLASSYKSIGLLAIHHNVPIVAGHARRVDPRAASRDRLEFNIATPPATADPWLAATPDDLPSPDVSLQYELSITDIIEPHDWADRPDPLFYVTARFNHAIERMIRVAPDQYLWLHRRWKSRPRHEREGRTMPERMIEKLRTLPWLSDDDVQAIVERSNREAAERR